MSFYEIVFCLSICIVISASNSDSVFVIETNGTKIIGRKLVTVFENKPFAAFWKIPYAAPPLGKLRFKVTLNLVFFLKYFTINLSGMFWFWKSEG